MLSNLFSGLAAKVLLGMFGLSMILNLGTCVSKNKEISSLNKQVGSLNNAVRDYKVAVATLKGNQSTLEAGIKSCNASVTNLANVRNALAASGMEALKEVQKANAGVAARVRSIDAMPKATCEDAFKILKSR